MRLQNTTAIILAGGRGARLGVLTNNTPKPLLPVAGRPFIFHLLDYLNEQGITEAILTIGYLASQFEETLGRKYKNIAIRYSIEKEPLGTGGALAQALKMVSQENVFVFNGDTLFKADLKELEKVHEQQEASLSVVLRQVEDTSRYGRIEFERELVTHFREKGIIGPGYINGGIYLIQKNCCSSFSETTYSLEGTLLPQFIRDGKIAFIASNQYFIDIGIPEDLEKGQREIQNIF